MSRTSLRGVAVATATVGLFAGTISAVAAAPSDVEAATAGYAPGLVSAMERDLNLSTAEAVARLESQELLADTQQSLEKSLGASYAGAWVEGSDALHVAVTDAAQAADVRAAGATPVTVDNSLKALDAWTADLDGALSRSVVQASSAASEWSTVTGVAPAARTSAASAASVTATCRASAPSTQAPA